MKGVKVMTTAMIKNVVSEYSKRVDLTSAFACTFASAYDHRDYRSDSKSNGRLRCLI